MLPLHQTTLWSLLDTSIGTIRTVRLCQALAIDKRVLIARRPVVSRAELAQALIMRLFENVVREVPTAAAYVRDAVRAGRKLQMDHGALRTVLANCGALPAGNEAFARILEPLGFEVSGLYPLERLAMTGRAYSHKDLPDSIAQFFVSELHVDRFSPAFQQAVQRVVRTSRDPLTLVAKTLLAKLRKHGELKRAEAQLLLPNLLACFGRQHDEPWWRDYQLLLAESQEMAWIATEGNTFNHAADRVDDVEAVAAAQRRLGRTTKDAVEVSASGRVIQTAFRAATVARHFVTEEGLRTELVPGSFHEFISRAPETEGDNAGRLDLRFDSANAQGIFGMTAAPDKSTTTLQRDGD